jgi:hypothetical protein
MIQFFNGVLTFLNAFFHSRYSLGLEIFALRRQLGVLKRKHPRISCESGIEYSGFCSAVFGPHGATLWLSSNERPLSPDDVDLTESNQSEQAMS